MSFIVLPSAFTALNDAVKPASIDEGIINPSTPPKFPVVTPKVFDVIPRVPATKTVSFAPLDNSHTDILFTSVTFELVYGVPFASRLLYGSTAPKPFAVAAACIYCCVCPIP